MNLTQLLTNEMVGASTKLAAADSPMLAVPEVAPLHPQVVEAHGMVVAAQRADHAVSPEAVKIIAEQERVDRKHDALARAVDSGLTLAANLEDAKEAPEPARLEQLEKTRRAVLPDGLKVVNSSFHATAGHAERLQPLLAQDAQLQQTLRSIPVADNRSLLDVTKEWVASGLELGKWEAQLNALPPSKRPEVSMQQARRQWNRVMSLVLHALEASRASAEKVAVVRAPLEDAANTAARRVAARKPKGA